MWTTKCNNVIFLFSIALALRLLVFVSVLLLNPAGVWVFDSYSYWQIGYNLIHNGIYSQTYEGVLQADYFRTPVYPLLLSFFQLVGPGAYGALLLQILASSFTTVLVYKITLRISANTWAAFIAGLFIALDIPSIVFSNLILTEAIFTFLFTLSIYFFVKYRETNALTPLVFSSIFLSLGLLTRPIAVFTYILFIILIFLFNKKRSVSLKSIGVFILTALIVLSPWLIRNYKTFGGFFISQIGSYVLLNYHAASIVSEKENIPFNSAQSGLRLKVFQEFKKDPDKHPVEYAEFTRSKSIEIITSNKLIFLKQHISGVISVMFKPVRGYIDNMLGFTKGYQSASASTFVVNKYTLSVLMQLSTVLSLILVVFQLLLSLVIYSGAIKGLIVFWKSYDKLLLILFVVLLFYFFNVTTPPFNEARFRVPAVPLLAVISGIGLASLRKLKT